LLCFVSKIVTTPKILYKIEAKNYNILKYSDNIFSIDTKSPTKILKYLRYAQSRRNDASSHSSVPAGLFLLSLGEETGALECIG
jgi:hypothetical protein